MVHFYSNTKTLIASDNFFISSLDIHDSAVEENKKNSHLKPNARRCDDGMAWHGRTASFELIGQLGEIAIIPKKIQSATFPIKLV